MDERDFTTLGDKRGMLSWHYSRDRSICTRQLPPQPRGVLGILDDAAAVAATTMVQILLLSAPICKSGSR
jgi:hypothetical protein